MDICQPHPKKLNQKTNPFFEKNFSLMHTSFSRSISREEIYGPVSRVEPNFKMEFCEAEEEPAFPANIPT